MTRGRSETGWPAVVRPVRTAWLGAVAVLAGLSLWAALDPGQVVCAAEGAPGAGAEPSPTLTVRWKEVQTEGGVTRVRLETSAPVKAAVKSSSASRAVEIDLPGADLSAVPAHVQISDGTVESVDARTSASGGTLVLTLASPGEADVVPWAGGIDVLARLAGGAPAAAPAAASSQPLVKQLTSPERLVFTLGKMPTNLSSFVLSDGKRLVVDADGVEIAAAQAVEELTDGSAERVRLARQDGRVRAVVEGRTAGVFEGHRLEKTADGFLLYLGGAPQVSGAQEPASTVAKPAVSAAVKPSVSPEPPPQGGGSVVEFGFRQVDGKSLVELVLSKSAPHIVRESSARRVVVDVLRTVLPDKFRRALDTSSFSGPVRLVAAYSRAGKGKTTDTRIVVDLRKAAPYRVERQGTKLSLVVDGGAVEPPAPGVADLRKEPKELVVVEGKPGRVPEKPEVSAEKAAKGEDSATAGYTGRRLSMDFMDADIRNVLRLIGEVSGLNMVTGDDVQGKVTIRLVDVPWDQALEVILKTKSLDQVREGNVIRIAPAEKLAAEKTRLREAEKGVEEKAPLVSDIVAVNYATASELADKVKALLTPRGSVAVDQRTNALLVKDVAEKLKEVQKFVARLDTPTPQVLIEARIVEVSTDFSKDLGIQWGGKYTADAAHGNSTKWAFPNSIGLVGSSGTGNYAVNFPASGGAGLSLSLGHVADILNLDLRISALESAGQGRVVSSPRVSTLDNREAEISQGLSVPFTTATQDKIETKSIDYLLKLRVTPHVTSDKSIIMKINLSKDSPSNTYVAVDSKTPAKETKTALTEVLVRDGETTVIGGIITDDKSDTRSGVPLLSRLPWIGWIFRDTITKDRKTELVIFITPKILNASPVAGNP